ASGDFPPPHPRRIFLHGRNAFPRWGATGFACEQSDCGQREGRHALPPRRGGGAAGGSAGAACGDLTARPVRGRIPALRCWPCRGGHAMGARSCVRFPMTVTALLPYLAALLLAGGFAGILAGLLGVGGGIVLVPAFVAILTAAGYGGPDMLHVCLAPSRATLFVTSIRSVLAQHRKGAVEWQILRLWAPWIMLGAMAGVWLVSRLGTRELQLIFAVLVF